LAKGNTDCSDRKRKYSNGYLAFLGCRRFGCELDRILSELNSVNLALHSSLHPKSMVKKRKGKPD